MKQPFWKYIPVQGWALIIGLTLAFLAFFGNALFKAVDTAEPVVETQLQ